MERMEPTPASIERARRALNARQYRTGFKSAKMATKRAARITTYLAQIETWIIGATHLWGEFQLNIVGTDIRVIRQHSNANGKWKVGYSMRGGGTWKRVSRSRVMNTCVLGDNHERLTIVGYDAALITKISEGYAIANDVLSPSLLPDVYDEKMGKLKFKESSDFD